MSEAFRDTEQGRQTRELLGEVHCIILVNTAQRLLSAVKDMFGMHNLCTVGSPFRRYS